MARKKQTTRKPRKTAVKKVLKEAHESMSREEYIEWIENVIRGVKKYDVMTARGDVETLSVDAKTAIIFGKELTKLRGWLEHEEEVEQASKVVFYIPDNGKVA